VNSAIRSYDGFYHYPPVDDRAMQWGVYLTGAGRGVIHPGQPYPPRTHPRLYDFQWTRGRTLPEFQLILLTDGHGEFESHETGLRKITPGSLIFLFPGVWHRYRPERTTGWTERWISFQGEIAHRLMRLDVIRPAWAVQPARDPDGLQAGFDRLLARIHAQPGHNSVLLSMHALALLADAVEQTGQVAAPSIAPASPHRDRVDDPVVAGAIELIWTHSHRQISIEHIARALAVTRRTLDRRFRRVTGRSVLEEITRCRLSRARRLLTETDLPVKTVAVLAGFPSEERMRLAFLRAEHATPSAYRHAAP